MHANSIPSVQPAHVKQAYIIARLGVSKLIQKLAKRLNAILFARSSSESSPYGNAPVGFWVFIEDGS
jgi:hypothetical protein